MKSFLRWTGSKARTKYEIIEEFPIRFNNYFEPCLGSGSIFFSLIAAKRIFAKAYLSDINKHLINCFCSVRDEPERVKKVLLTYLEKNSEEFYYSMRPNVGTPAGFIYLNRAGFSSLYRENSKGEFNVPYRANDFNILKRKISMDTTLIDSCSEYLQKYCPFKFEKGHPDNHLFCSKWDHPVSNLNLVNAGDLVYFDPPYLPYNDTGFVNYSKEGFNESDHVYMNNIAKQLKKKGAHVFLSNSYTKKSIEIFGEPKKVMGVVDSVNANMVDKGKRLEGLWVYS